MSRESQSREENRDSGMAIYFPEDEWEAIQKGQVVLRKIANYTRHDRIGQSLAAHSSNGQVGNVLVVAIKTNPEDRRSTNFYYILDTPENRATIPLGAKGETS